VAKKKAAKKASGRGAGPGGARRPALDPVSWGLLLTALVAGPPLWTLYQAGDIDLTTVLLRAGVVAVGCGVGVTLLNQLIDDYGIKADRERRIQKMMEALDDVVHEGLPIQDGTKQGRPDGPPAAPGTASKQKP
jgi:hypothetical protein